MSSENISTRLFTNETAFDCTAKAKFKFLNTKSILKEYKVESCEGKTNTRGLLALRYNNDQLFIHFSRLELNSYSCLSLRYSSNYIRKRE